MGILNVIPSIKLKGLERKKIFIKHYMCSNGFWQFPEESYSPEDRKHEALSFRPVFIHFELRERVIAEDTG